MAHNKTGDKLAASVACIVPGNCKYKDRNKLASSVDFTCKHNDGTSSHVVCFEHCDHSTCTQTDGTSLVIVLTRKLAG